MLMFTMVLVTIITTHNNANCRPPVCCVPPAGDRGTGCLRILSPGIRFTDQLGCELWWGIREILTKCLISMSVSHSGVMLKVVVKAFDVLIFLPGWWCCCPLCLPQASSHWLCTGLRHRPARPPSSSSLSGSSTPPDHLGDIVSEVDGVSWDRRAAIFGGQHCWEGEEVEQKFARMLTDTWERGGGWGEAGRIRS